MQTPISNTHRFFVSPDVIHQADVTITDNGLIHQIRRVLRLHVDDRILLLDGNGQAYVVVLTSMDNQHITGSIEYEESASGEPATRVTLYTAMIRAERFEWVLQKGTELGVHQFVPVIFSRTQKANHTNERKLARWRTIIREAAEQACRGFLPVLHEPVSFETACQHAAQSRLAVLLSESTDDTDLSSFCTLRSVVRWWLETHHPTNATVAIMSGPEGGITLQELTGATEHGIIPVSLGPRILRAETAPIAAAAAIFYEMEE